MNLSETEENYLKAVFYICFKEEKAASTNAIALRLKTTAASVSDMLKRLDEKGLVNYEKYKGVELSKEGRNIAVRLVRKHRLWEVFLVDKLGFQWDEVHEVAEQLEHIKSPELIRKLDEYLAYPKFDPHGDPIPNEEGCIEKIELDKLSSYQEGDELVLMGVSDSSAEFLQYLNLLGLALGRRMILRKRYSFDASNELDVAGKSVLVSQQVANRLLMKKLA